MTFLSKDQLSEGKPCLSQRGRAAMELLGNIQDVSSGYVRDIAQQQFESDVVGSELTKAEKPVDAKLDRERLAGAKQVANNIPSYRYERFLQRYVAEEVYYRGIPTVEERRSEFERLSLNSNSIDDGELHGSLELNSDTHIPSYYEGTDWHLEPGGYDGYDLYGDLFTHVAGPYVFKYGGYAAVPNRQDIISHRVNVMKRLPKDSYPTIYDAGCGGFSTLSAANKVYPGAELIGCDISELLLKNGHAHAERIGVPVTFKQCDARETGETDGSMSAVVLYSVFHEMPQEVSIAILQEMYRILEPGGDIVISDPPPFRAVDPFYAVILDWDTEHRGEPYFSEAGFSNWGEELRKIGFVNVSETALDDNPMGYPWVTLGSKPA